MSTSFRSVDMVNKQRLIKETRISKHLHNKEPLAPYGESDTARRLYHTAASIARWNVHDRDTTRRLYHTEPLVRHVEMYTKVTRPAVCTTHSR